MAHKDDKKNSFYGASTNDPRPSKLGPKFSSVRALTDIALIAFEVEHERNRLQEELSRLEAAQDDTMRSLEILDFMAARMDDDPLVNASKNPLLSPTAHPSTSMNGDGGQNAITAASASSHTSLEYLPSSTMIRLANRQLKKLRDIAIGDRILSLCINSYPSVAHGAEKRDSLLPKMKQPFKRSASGLPSSRTVHALSHANISVPIMLPPPPVHPNESDEFQDDEMKDIHQRYHNQKENNSRASMPFISYHNANNASHDSHNGTHNGHNGHSGHSGHNGHMNGYASAAKPRNTSPTNNLIRLSQTDLVKDSLATDNHSPNNHSSSSNNSNNLSTGAINKMRSKSVAQAHLKKSIGLPMVSPPPPMAGALTKSRSLHSSQHGHPRQRSTTSFPTGNYLSHTAYKHPQSRSTNSSPRFSTSAAQSHNSSSNNSTPKKPRVSFQDSNVNGHSNSGGRKDNYLESVTVLQIVESKIYRLIEIITDNNFKIRCSPTHVFWICGKGWGCVDSKSRNLSEAKSPKQTRFVHELKAGELLLSVAGKKYRISTINVLDKPKGIAVCALVVSKNDCFFANDLLVKHSMS